MKVIEYANKNPTKGCRFIGEHFSIGKTCVEADDIPRMTIQSWIERLPELTAEYELKDIWNMDELGLFFEALPEKGLAQKSKKCKGGKKSKQRFTAAFFVAADGSKVSQPIVIWKSKSPRCFKTRPSMVYYFTNDKAWMRTEWKWC